MEANLIDFKNHAPLGKVSLDERLFGLSYRPDILSLVTNWQLAAARAGTHKTKGISDISGTTRKPYKQKGTGRARQGSLRSPQFRGGAVIFGPVVRSHAFKVNKKIRRLGIKVALSFKHTNDAAFILEDSVVPGEKTSDLAKWIQNQEIFGCDKKILIVSGSCEKNLRRVAGNLHKVKVLNDSAINVYDLLKHDILLIDKDAIAKLEERLL